MTLFIDGKEVVGPLYLGVDPGDSSGGVALIDANGRFVDAVRLTGTKANPLTPRDLYRWVWEYGTLPGIDFAVLERVKAMPRDGGTSAFKFGASWGKLYMLLVSCGIPFDEPTPSQWQGAMNCRTKGDKKVTRNLAAKLWPETRVTHWNADALLMAEYARRLAAERRPA